MTTAAVKCEKCGTKDEIRTVPYRIQTKLRITDSGSVWVKGYARAPGDVVHEDRWAIAVKWPSETYSSGGMREYVPAFTVVYLKEKVAKDRGSREVLCRSLTQWENTRKRKE